MLWIYCKFILPQIIKSKTRLWILKGYLPLLFFLDPIVTALTRSEISGPHMFRTDVLQELHWRILSYSLWEWWLGQDSGSQQVWVKNMLVPIQPAAQKGILANQTYLNLISEFLSCSSFWGLMLLLMKLVTKTHMAATQSPQKSLLLKEWQMFVKRMTGAMVPWIQQRKKRSFPDFWRSCAIIHTITYAEETTVPSFHT